MSNRLDSIDSVYGLIKVLESVVQGLRELREIVREESVALEMVDMLIEQANASIDRARDKVVR